jgi:hypothetical protein
MSFLTMQHGQFALQNNTVIKATPGAAFFGQDILFDIPSWLTGTKLENTGIY